MDDSKSHSGRRAHDRTPRAYFAWYQTIEPNGGAPVEGISYSVDISAGGVGLIAQHDVEPGTLVLVEILMDYANARVSAVGSVVHARATDDGCYRWGVRFLALPPDSRQIIGFLSGGVLDV